MNGTIYDKIKQNGDSKKKEKLKFFVALFSTNLLVALLCLTFGHEKKEETALSSKPTATLHPHFKMIVTPLIVLADNNEGITETPVTLINKAKKIIIQKAYLHEKVESQNKELEGSPRFKIEIPEDEVIKLSADEGELMIAIPELKLSPKEKKLSNKRVSQYEVSL